MLLVYCDQDNKDKSVKKKTKAGADAENTIFSILMVFKRGSWGRDSLKNVTKGSDSVGSKWQG